MSTRQTVGPLFTQKSKTQFSKRSFSLLALFPPVYFSKHALFTHAHDNMISSYTVRYLSVLALAKIAHTPSYSYTCFIFSSSTANTKLKRESGSCVSILILQYVAGFIYSTVPDNYWCNADDVLACTHASTGSCCNIKESHGLLLCFSFSFAFAITWARDVCPLCCSLCCVFFQCFVFTRTHRHTLGLFTGVVYTPCSVFTSMKSLVYHAQCVVCVAT